MQASEQQRSRRRSRCRYRTQAATPPRSWCQCGRVKASLGPRVATPLLFASRWRESGSLFAQHCSNGTGCRVPRRGKGQHIRRRERFLECSPHRLMTRANLPARFAAPSGSTNWYRSPGASRTAARNACAQKPSKPGPSVRVSEGTRTPTPWTTTESQGIVLVVVALFAGFSRVELGSVSLRLAPNQRTLGRRRR